MHHGVHHGADLRTGGALRPDSGAQCTVCGPTPPPNHGQLAPKTRPRILQKLATITTTISMVIYRIFTLKVVRFIEMDGASWTVGAVVGVMERGSQTRESGLDW